MAKLTGPLFSLDARGKLGKALVFIGWKGIKTVRQWLKPANPQEADQGDIRIAIGGLGRSVGKVQKDKAYSEKLKALDVIPDQQSKQSYLVQYIKTQYFAGKGATFTGNYAGQLASLTGHTAYTSWGVGADALNIVEFDLAYASISPFDKALGIYLLAKAAIALNFTGSPYTPTALSAWTGAQIDKLVNHFTT